MRRVRCIGSNAFYTLAFLCCTVPAFAQPPCPPGQVFAAAVAVGGAGAGTLTIRPGGGGGFGETFVGAGVPIRVCVTCNGVPFPGIPASQITVAGPGVVFCPAPNSDEADTPTNGQGCADFVGTICGGGCAPFLNVFVAGTFAGAVPVRVNSTDSGVASPGFVDASDLAGLAAMLGAPALYTFCRDFNEDGFIDAADLAYFATALGAAACGAVCP